MTAPGRQHGNAHGHERFQGASGLVIGAVMLVGRGAVSRLVADLAGVGPGDRVLDVGCGPWRGGPRGRAPRRGGHRGRSGPADARPGPLPVPRPVRARHCVRAGDS